MSSKSLKPKSLSFTSVDYRSQQKTSELTDSEFNWFECLISSSFNLKLFPSFYEFGHFEASKEGRDTTPKHLTKYWRGIEIDVNPQ